MRKDKIKLWHIGYVTQKVITFLDVFYFRID